MRSKCTSAEFEKMLMDYSLTFDSYTSDEAERAKLPTMVEVYNDLCKEEVPQQSVFVQRVVDLATFKDERGVRARAARTYPSLVRQHHFSIVLREHFPIVHHSLELDVLHGLDFMVVRYAFVVGVCLTVKTKRGFMHHRRKAAYTDSWRQIPIVTLTPDKEVGAWWLHSAEQTTTIQNRFEAYIAQVKKRLISQYVSEQSVSTLA